MSGGAKGERARASTSYLLAALSLVFLILAETVARRPPVERGAMLRAADLMKKATAAVGRCRESRGIPIDSRADPNRTGFIGLEGSTVTTSLGILEAKRTTANPDFAGLIVDLLQKAGVRRGDAVAIGASSSFPALITAALCACRALEIRPLLICSLGASQWGANHPEFTWLEIEDCLRSSGLLDVRPLAVSLGGEGDVGLDMAPEGRAWLVRKAAASGFPFLYEPHLETNVARRIDLYQSAAEGGPIRAFINIGGGYANMGTDSEVLRVKPGLAVFDEIPPHERRGMIFEMAARRIPVIHLLYVRGLCEEFGLPWDPTPLPEPGSGEFYRARSFSAFPLAVISGTYFSLGGLLILVLRRKLRKEPDEGGRFTSG